MTLYELIVFLHVLAVIVWVGGGIMLQLLLQRARSTGPEAIAMLGDSSQWTSVRVFMPSSFIVLGTGVWAVIAGDWSFADLWISLGFTGFFLSIVLGMAVLRPTSKKMAALAAERGPQDPQVLRLARRVDTAGWINLAILVGVVLDMVVKPGA